MNEEVGAFLEPESQEPVGVLVGTRAARASAGRRIRAVVFRAVWIRAYPASSVAAVPGDRPPEVIREAAHPPGPPAELRGSERTAPGRSSRGSPHSLIIGEVKRQHRRDQFRAPPVIHPYPDQPAERPVPDELQRLRPEPGLVRLCMGDRGVIHPVRARVPVHLCMSNRRAEANTAGDALPSTGLSTLSIHRDCRPGGVITRHAPALSEWRPAIFGWKGGDWHECSVAFPSCRCLYRRHVRSGRRSPRAGRRLPARAGHLRRPGRPGAGTGDDPGQNQDHRPGDGRASRRRRTGPARGLQCPVGVGRIHSRSRRASARHRTGASFRRGP